jgi:glycosyltransferase involved in cell wall biosynthesis
VSANLSDIQLQTLYAKAKIFWHTCRLDASTFHASEPVDLAVIAAMQNRCVPIVGHSVGQHNIVQHGKSGFVFDTADELCQQTLQLVTDHGLWESLQEGAYQRSRCFTRARFEGQVKRIFDTIQREYSTIHLPDPQEVAKIVFNVRISADRGFV